MNKVITIAHQKGGVGKSTLAIQIAIEFSKNHRVTLLDLDLQRSVSIFNSIRKDTGLKLLNIKIIKDDKELIDTLNKTDGLLIIDSGGFDSTLNRLAILGADMVITPVSSSLIEIAGLEKLKHIIIELRKIKKDIKSYILFNSINPTAKKVIGDLKDFIKSNKEYFKLLNVVVRRRIIYQTSFAEGKSVVEIDPDGKAADEIRKCCNNIITVLQ